jgi:hypothetical protein
MSIRTLEDLQDKLDEEFAWRKRDLGDAVILISKSQGTKKQDFHIRASVTMLYAHWEGFLKAISISYLEFVSNAGLSNSDLADNFMGIIARKVYARATSGGTSSAFIELARFFRNDMLARAMLPFRDTIKTMSNLNSDVLREIVLLLGLDYSRFSTSEKLINETLLKNRNNIAHGAYMPLKEGEYLELHLTIVSLMTDFSNQIVNAATLETYRLP